jgi:hypothetical protein
LTDSLTPALNRTPRHTAFDDDDTTALRGVAGERALWAAVLRRALMDAKGMRLGSDPKAGDNGVNYVQREARKWFKRRSREVRGWGWMIDILGFPPGVVSRIEGDALINGRTPFFDSLFGRGN